MQFNTKPDLSPIVDLAGIPCRVALSALAFGEGFVRLPHVFRIWAENLLRQPLGQEERAQALAAMRAWLETGTSTAELSFLPGRLMMHDTTCTPALADIAAMRDVIAQSGGDPASLAPLLPVDVSVDHSIGVDVSGRPDAVRINQARDYERNGERYRFLKWATLALPGVRVHPPGTGIMHTINLEQLATVVTISAIDGESWAVPDTLIGTDSHTPMVNGIGVLGWGVGGPEAESVMFGIPVTMRLPDVVGVRLRNRLRDGVTATDLALAVTQRLRRHNVAGAFVEFFGPGVSTLSGGERAVIANMAPEFGASTAYFPVDARTLQYLAATGRELGHIALVEAYARLQGFWFEPDAAPRYTSIVDIDLDEIAVSLAGPRRPQDLVAPEQVRASLAGLAPSTVATPALPRYPVAIAAITSCTNTTDARLLIAAGLLARKARRLGLAPPAWTKTSLAPGSPAAAHYLARSGLLADLEALGFGIVGYGCTTCIGQSGPLPPAMQSALADDVVPVAIISGNRNFPGRIHGQIDAGFLASPPLVIAYALAGDADRDIAADPIGQATDGRDVRLVDIWPTGAEIDAALSSAVQPGDFASAFAAASADAMWAELDAPATARFPWDPASTYLRAPPFATPDQPARLGDLRARALLVLGDDITTDHISPAGQTPPNSEAGRWLVAHGENPADLNVYASRRGNWEVMLRGLFTNRTLLNQLGSGIPPGSTIDAGTGEVLPLYQAARRYTQAGIPRVIVAGERYGTGSSRDWAAKGVALLGVNAILAKSFERIHRSNLIGMGIVPLVFAEPIDLAALALTAQDIIELPIPSENLTPRSAITVTITGERGRREIPMRLAVETELECAILRSGGVIPLVLQSRLAGAP
ncbi:aconitate hydratase AcnA [Bosea sp. MMO-172]|uniref:aconitate hydratase AcnA n=1 Tax=Bosea sp. MMO-172 TaxID=3127885 RepID=UPI0030194C59